MWNLPTNVIINGIIYDIRNRCDYRIILDVITALNDNELELEWRVYCALYIFYEKMPCKENIQEAISQMMKVINVGKDIVPDDKPVLMNWEHDFPYIAPPISRVLGYSVRSEEKYTHWYDFIGAYMEIGDCLFSHIVSIRNKRIKGKKLDENELQFYKGNREAINLPYNLTKEEQKYLDFD